MARKYKSSYKTRRNVSRFHVSFEAQPTTQERATICEDCGGGIEEVMTVNRCFRCEGIRRRNQPDPRIARRDNILAIFEGEPVSKETAAELINELAEIDQALQFKPADAVQLAPVEEMIF